jgi:catechol-2,3-dioxygenase
MCVELARECDMTVVGIEKIFLKVKDMETAIEFYNGILGIPLSKQDGESTYLLVECDRHGCAD